MDTKITIDFESNTPGFPDCLLLCGGNCSLHDIVVLRLEAGEDPNLYVESPVAGHHEPGQRYDESLRDFVLARAPDVGAGTIVSISQIKQLAQNLIADVAAGETDEEIFMKRRYRNDEFANVNADVYAWTFDDWVRDDDGCGGESGYERKAADTVESIVSDAAACNIVLLDLPDQETFEALMKDLEAESDDAPAVPEPTPRRRKAPRP